MKTSEKGVEFIAKMEGFEPFPYNDPAGHATIGFGHLLHLGPVTDEDRLAWGAGGITVARGLELLRDDLVRVENVLEGLARGARELLSQHEVDALASFTFNVGAAAFQKSTLRGLVRDGHTQRVPEELLRWVYADGKRLPGLVKRRVLEAAIWVAGVYA